MSLPDQFPQITRRNEPLAPHTHLRIGGPAEFLLQPRTLDELKAVLAACQKQKIPVRMLGGGCNLLVRDDPVPGAVVRLTAPPFTFLQRDGRKLVAGGGAQLFDLVALAVTGGLARHGVGRAELSERNANYVIAHPGTTAADILQLAEQMRERVRERTGVRLERELHVW